MTTTAWGRPFDQRAEAQVPPQPGDRLPQPTAPAERQLAKDRTSGRIGEIMPHPIPERLCGSNGPRKMRLRPVGGGLEWTPDRTDVYLVDALGRCLRCRDTRIVVIDIPVADGFISDPRPCPDCAVTA